MGMTEMTEEERRKFLESQWALPGTARANEIARAEAQQPWTADLVDGLQTTAAAGAARVVADEAAPIADEIYPYQPEDVSYLNAHLRMGAVAIGSGLSLLGFRGGENNYNKSDKYEELTTGIPFEYHDDIMENDNYDAALRARTRVMDDLRRGQRMAAQDSGQLAMLAGSLFDVDLPLSFFSGGAYGSSKLAGLAFRLGNRMRLSASTSMRAAGAFQGANAGLQAGALVGAADAALRETTGWQDVANMALQSALLGTAVGGATKGDIRPTLQAAQEDFFARLARDDRAYRTNPDVGSMQGDDITLYMPEGAFQVRDGAVVGPAQESTVGAQQAVPNLGFTPTTISDASPVQRDIILGAETWRHDTGWGDRKLDEDDTWWGKVANSFSLNLSTNDFRQLYTSKSAVMNFFAGNIFESANGLGRGHATAAVRMENYHNRMQSHLGPKVLTHQLEWAKRHNQTMSGSGYGISQEGIRQFNRELMLEMNARQLGRTSTRDPLVQRAADQYDLAGLEGHAVGKGRDGETALDGFDTIPTSNGYTPYRWDGTRINQIIKSGIASRADIEAALAQSYQAAGMGVGKDSQAVAKAVIQRALAKDADMDMSVFSLLTADGKEFLRESMVMAGMPTADADRVIERLTGSQHNRSREGFAKSRNDVDMEEVVRTSDGSDLRIVDLLDNDMHGLWQRYTRQMAGAAALARHGITNRAKRREFIDAARAEQRALGEEPLEVGRLEAMFSHFNAGPVHGFARGQTNEGIGVLALAKRITNLSLLEKLGVTQLAETGTQIAQNGLANWLSRGPMAIFDRELKAGNQTLLDDLSFITGELGQEHWHFAPWLDLDDVSNADKADWLYQANRISSMGSFVQGYTSVFNQVRSFQQRTAVLGNVDRVMREIKNSLDTGSNIDDTLMLRFADMGIDTDHIRQLENLILNGTVEFKTHGSSTFVNKLNIALWSPDLSEVFGSAIVRNMNQIVQKAMPGEQGAWMHTHAGSLLLHLKTFPLLAIQKQVVRNARFMDKQALAMVLYGLATAAVASKVRDALDGVERTPLETAKQAFNYSNLTGFIPMVYDPVMTLLGMDNARINQFGPYYDWTPPTLNMLNSVMRMPGAVANSVTGEADWYDQQAIKAIPFAGTYVLSRMFD